VEPKRSEGRCGNKTLQSPWFEQGKGGGQTGCAKMGKKAEKGLVEGGRVCRICYWKGR